MSALDDAALENSLSFVAADRDSWRVLADKANERAEALAADLIATRKERDALLAENADLKSSVVAFGAPWAVRFAEDRGLPPGHLHPGHYDILKAAGARMDDFTRATTPTQEPTT